ncbi:hypothetical protein CHLRE_03g191250v5 [Chlamydomonas reinhardtii]|uniref:Uncharacterized protein n=1 Tax=Chlamydomonas reinhardtii TaxID=3055 RepID=A0A2K3DYB3_CHLRE|nr:uncharacterized protein CHLRE_03g191250v5 [Chlamydomonas reinhardtii]PNW85536.1 hypothetical protein CHLRE_03g191250v5 [Chlamydomonas reinhardtii]
MSLTISQLQRQRVGMSGRAAGVKSAGAIARSVSLVCRAQASSSHTMNNALALGASAATSALIAKVGLLNPGLTLASTLQTKTSDKALEVATSSWQAAQSSTKIAVATAPAPAATASPFAALPSQWLVVTSAAHWFEQHRLAAESGALLATVFVSDAAARAQGPLLERLRRTYGGEAGPVHFVFVHVGASYVQRSAAASRSAAAAGLRGREALADLGRVSNVAALHGLDVALGSFLPNGGLRAVPSMLLSQPSSCESACASVSSSMDLDTAAARCWAAASRAGELRQLVSDWAFINTALARAAAASTAVAAATAVIKAKAVAMAAVPRDGEVLEGSSGAAPVAAVVMAREL